MYGVLRVAQHLRRRALLDDPPVVQHDDAVGEQVDDGEVVGDEERGESELAPAARANSSSTRACTETSSALVGSSAMSSFGSSASARARRARWRWPPRQLVRVPVAVGARQLHRLEQLVDLGAGVRRIARAGRGRSAARRRTAAIVSSGLKLVAGSWKTKPSSLRARAELPLPHAEHLGAEHPQRAAGHRGEAAIARPIVVLPDPLSPTSPSTSPGAIVKLTPVHGAEGRPPEAARILDHEVVGHDDGARPRSA